MEQPLRKSGHLLGDALIGMVILIFISLVVVLRQFLPLAQQTGHTHSSWDVAHWELLLAPPTPDPLSIMLPFEPQITPTQGGPPIHSIRDPHNSALSLLFPHPLQGPS